MPNNGFRGLIMAFLVTGLGGCGGMPIGPDLARPPSPFGDTPIIRLVSTSPDDNAPPIEIFHGNAADIAVLPNTPVSPEKSLDALITWQAFDGGVADGQAYWLVGANVFRTPDRSSYAVLRFPSSARFTSKSTTHADLMVLSCEMRTGYPPPALPASENASEDTVAESIGGENKGEEPKKDCDFNSREDINRFLPLLMTAARQDNMEGQKKTGDDSETHYQWEKIDILIP
ncbi:hypothetical protein AEAC466_12490 [Asticcacaulis sp. AC466]|uniref:hypothetical protein n=1 Tax=Asticcacaulis sp. AC466 TaxID=1282362 RepID=UPI0003C40B4F|nr:hypothetical protein [Asticcacaulis sp. AC466]ESQ83487.1 hypothetical protein AEAC466_12490 [Asticcacaulis sp. AC466]